jgi:hypothetical protein
MDAVKITKGTLVCADASAGYATGIPTLSRPFFGVAYETVDNSGGSAGDKSIRVYTSGVHSFIAASAVQTWVGQEVWLSSGSSGNNATVVIADPGIGPKVGRVVEVVSATEVRVLITGYAFNVDAEAS